MSVTLEDARALWCRKQGLSPRLGGDALHVVARTGWVRTLAGVDVYLAVRARSPAITRETMDQQVADCALRVVPAARGCMYLIPNAHRGLALAHARSMARARTERDLRKAGVLRDEVERLADAVRALLESKGDCTTAEIRAALPAGSVRRLGDAGKRVGLSSPLPVALRKLEFTGAVERVLEDGRLDSERYHWRALPTERHAFTRAFDDVQVRARELVRFFLNVAGPAADREVATWSGLSLRDTRSALARLEAAPVDIVDADGSVMRRAFVLPDDVESLAVARAEAPRAGFHFLPFEDNLLTLHGGPAVHVHPRFHDHPIRAWGSSRPTTLGLARHVGQRALLLGHEMVGFWEFDPDAGEVVCATFEPLDRHHRKILARERDALATFIREELGHARSFSLDTDAAVRDRAAALRAMG